MSEPHYVHDKGKTIYPQKPKLKKLRRPKAHIRRGEELVDDNTSWLQPVDTIKEQLQIGMNEALRGQIEADLDDEGEQDTEASCNDFDLLIGEEGLIFPSSKLWANLCSVVASIGGTNSRLSPVADAVLLLKGMIKGTVAPTIRNAVANPPADYVLPPATERYSADVKRQYTDFSKLASDPSPSPLLLILRSFLLNGPLVPFSTI